MQIELRFFASLRETIGVSSERWSTQASTVAELRRELVARGHPYAQALAPGRAVRAALNQVLVDEAAALVEGAEVAFFPPVTGG